MRYSILGFNQQKVCTITKEVQESDGKVKIYKLDMNDLIILKDIAEFMNRSNIIKYTMNDKIYFSITHTAILQDLPILDIKKQALKDRIDKLCLLGVIEKQVVRNDAGTWIGYRLTGVYESLLYSNDDESNGVYQTTRGGYSKLHEGGVVNYNPNNNSTIKELTIKKEEKELKEKEIDDFVERIYKLYPTKCPIREISTGKCAKDKTRIKGLLKKYTMDEIESVIRKEVSDKMGKHPLKNFSTFLNNFPDPNSLFIDLQQSGGCDEEALLRHYYDTLTDTQQAEILHLDAYQFHMLSEKGKDEWRNARKGLMLKWIREHADEQ